MHVLGVADDGGDADDLLGLAMGWDDCEFESDGGCQFRARVHVCDAVQHLSSIDPHVTVGSYSHLHRSNGVTECADEMWLVG